MNGLPGNNPMDRGGVIFAGVVISALGALTYNLLPLFLGTAQDYRELSDQAVGILSSSFYVGFTLATVTAFFWIRRFNWRVVTFVAIPIAAVAMLTVGQTANYGVMLAAMACAGGGFSVLYGIGTTVLSDTSQPARWYGLKIASEAGLGAVLLLTLPGIVVARWGFEGLMAAMAGVVVLLAPLLIGLPDRGLTENVSDSTRPLPAMPGALRLGLWLGLLGVFAYLFCTTMIWAFIERVANDAGFDPVTTGNILSLGLLLAITGSLAAMVAGERFGLALPLVLSITLLLTSLFLLGDFGSVAAYGLAACLFTFSFGMGIPYTVSVVAALDVDGRYVVLTVPAIGLGVMLAPAVGGFLSTRGGHGALLITAAISVVAALVLALLALRLGLNRARAYREEAGIGYAEPIV